MACWFQCWENSTGFGLLTLVLLMWKWMGLFLSKNHLWRCWGWPSLLNWIGTLTLSLLLKLPPTSMKLLSPEVAFNSINLSYAHIWNTVVTSGLVPPRCYMKLLDKLQKQICRVFRLLLLLNPCLIVEMWPA